MSKSPPHEPSGRDSAESEVPPIVASRASADPAASVRGYSAFDQPAMMSDRVSALLVDLGLATVLALLVLGLSGLAPIPDPLWALAIPPLYLLFWTLPRTVRARTVGELAWRLKPHEHAHSIVERLGLIPFARPLFRNRNSVARLPIGVVLTLMAWSLAAWIGFALILSHPILSRENAVRLRAFAPEGEEAGAWTTAPFFYALGAWPTDFKGQAVFYSIPYEKGPPERFIGHIVAHWMHPDLPEARFTLEGPKTPDLPLSLSPPQTPRGPIPRNAVRDCFERPIVRAASPVACLEIRDAVLARHIEEARELAPRSWATRWFSVQNPALTPDEEIQGVWVTATGDTRRQDRWIVVSPKGTQQTVILDSARGPDGDFARDLAERAVRSLRVQDDLKAGRAWIDRALVDTRLDDLKALADSEELVRKLARVQALLVAKVSVDPRTYDTYFHLGGTALMLARFAARHPRRNPDENLSGSAKTMVQSMLSFAQDISPDDPRTAQLQDFVTESASY